MLTAKRWLFKTNTLSIAALYKQQIIKPLKHKSQWWQLGIFGTLGKNQTQSDYVDNFRKKTVSDGRNIDGLGLSIGKRTGRIEIGTGILYTRHQYKPPPFDFIKRLFAKNSQKYSTFNCYYTLEF
ncbi:MAG: hypothetical protein HC817_04835 [Saprospiraceae bacterium]|nr:hypothetical protein [Saprospiraceae bacterium]